MPPIPQIVKVKSAASGQNKRLAVTDKETEENTSEYESTVNKVLPSQSSLKAQKKNRTCAGSQQTSLTPFLCAKPKDPALEHSRREKRKLEQLDNLDSPPLKQPRQQPMAIAQNEYESLLTPPLKRQEQEPVATDDAAENPNLINGTANQEQQESTSPSNDENRDLKMSETTKSKGNRMLKGLEPYNTPSQNQVDDRDVESAKQSKKRRYGKAVFPESKLGSLAAIVLKAGSQSIDWVVDEFNKSIDGEKVSKRQVIIKLHEIGEKTKLEGESRPIWSLKKESQHLVPFELFKSFQDARRERLEAKAKNKAKTKVVKRETVPVEDVRIGKYRTQLRTLLESAFDEEDFGDNLTSKHDETANLIASWKEWLKSESRPLQEIDDDQGIRVVACLTQGSTKTLDKLADEMVQRIGGTDWVAKQAFEERIVVTAERKCYGVKEKNTVSNRNENRDALWRWEVQNLSLLPQDAVKEIQNLRKSRNRLAAQINRLSRLISTLHQNVQGNLEKKIGIEEEKVAKFFREEELAKQKRQEQMKKKRKREDEKQAAKIAKTQALAEKKQASNKSPPQSKKPKITLNNFFVAVKTSAPEKAETPPLIPSDDTEKRLDDIMNQTTTQDSSLVMLRNEFLDRVRQFSSNPQKSGKRRRRRVNFQTNEKPANVADKHEDETAKKIVEAQRSKKKLFQFHENHRPPYFGTFRKVSDAVRARSPFAKDPSLDYSYDSDDEWEEPEDGESLADSENGSDVEQEGENDKELDYQDGWLMRDDLIEYESDVDDDDIEGEEMEDENGKKKRIRRIQGNSDPGAKLERYAVGIVYDADAIEASPISLQDKIHLLRRYRIQALPNNATYEVASFPLVVPTREEINSERLPKSKMKSKPKSQTPQVLKKLVTKKTLPVLVNILEGSEYSIGTVIEKFLAEIKMAMPEDEPASKAQIRLKIGKIAEKAKRIGDKKMRWYVHDNVLAQCHVNRR